MDNQNQTKPHANQGESRSPDYRISLVREREGGDVWANIGVGWHHNQGEGITFTGDLLKLLGFKLIAIKAQPKD